ncbi:ATP-binding cassette domain-containing protein [Pseudonocardia sp. ICBG1293]|uniref:ATP-binding cassette domain-containing protein n=1 Tax=Pseudonocardia sp. ICBG1293 TaxID=2844382 RepID=UPI001CD00090|nr:ATP-binding cassette domain-containing protein [Pseudonocardia sp. ICBG1293]
MTPGAAAVQLRGISKKYDTRAVLDNFDLEVHFGEMVGLTGPSGSGKSTVLNLASLLEVPDSGSVLISGVSAPSPRGRAAALLRRKKLGYLFQNFALIDGATVEYNLRLASAYVRGGTAKVDLIEQALERVGLSGTRKRQVYTLSGGEQQRVAVARLLVKPYEVVIADEPTGSLDLENTTAVLDLLDSLAELGKSVLLATHDPLVASRCSRTIQL